MTTNTTDHIGQYLEARIAVEQAVGLEAIGKAEAAARRVYRAADRADVTISAGIDDAARVLVHGLSAGERRNGITGYDPRTGATLFA